MCNLSWLSLSKMFYILKNTFDYVQLTLIKKLLFINLEYLYAFMCNLSKYSRNFVYYKPVTLLVTVHGEQPQCFSF